MIEYNDNIGVPENAYGYVYMNYYIGTDKWYIGRHKSNIIDWNYYGSGDIIIKSFREGILSSNDVCIMVLDWADSEDDLNDKEIYWIEYFNAVEDRNFYNIAAGGCYSDTDNPTFVPVICVELNKRFRTIKDAAEWCNRSKSALSHALTGSAETCAGYHWKLADKDDYYSRIMKSRSCSYNKEGSGFTVGSTHSEESKRKMRLSAIGRKHTEKAIEKMRKSQRMRFDSNPVSEETRKKLSIALSGENNPMYGKPSANKGGWHQPDSAKEAIRRARMGSKASEEAKRNMSIAQKERYKKNPVKPHVIEALRQANIGKELSEEHKKKLIEANTGRVKSEEERKKLSDALNGHKPFKYVEVYCPELDMTFHTIKEACKYVGLKDGRGIRSCIDPNSSIKHSGKYLIDGKLTKLSWKKIGDNYGKC